MKQIGLKRALVVLQLITEHHGPVYVMVMPVEAPYSADKKVRKALFSRFLYQYRVKPNEEVSTCHM